MTNIPDKCSRCGAPIDWEKGAYSTKCGYCGKINYLREFNLIQGKKYPFFSSIKNNSQKYLLHVKEKLKKDLKNQDIISEDLIYKYINRGINISKRSESKILLYALPIGLLILGINSYINSPLRVHNKKIKDSCHQSRISSINFGATKFESGTNYRECVKLMREVVLSLDKISRKSKTKDIFRESLKTYSEKLWEKSISDNKFHIKKYYIRQENDQGANIVYHHFFNKGQNFRVSEITVNLRKSYKDKQVKKSQSTKISKSFCRNYLKLYKKITRKSNEFDPKMTGREIGVEITKRETNFVKKVEKLKDSNLLINLFNEIPHPKNFRFFSEGDKPRNKKVQSLNSFSFLDGNERKPEYFYYEVYKLPTSIESALKTHKDDIAKDCRDFYKLN